MAAGRCRSAATSSGLRPWLLSSSASLPALVVFPEPWRPTMRIVSGGDDFFNGTVSPPRVVTSSSWTILITCWPGVSDLETPSPRARSLTRARKSLTTLTFTSASSSATRTSRKAASMSFSERRPLPRREPNTDSKRWVRVSNISGWVEVGGVAGTVDERLGLALSRHLDDGTTRDQLRSVLPRCR